MKLEEIKDIVKHCTYTHGTEVWEIIVRLDDKRPYLQVSVPDGKCNVTGEPLPWRGRKWMLSYHMCQTEIVRTAFMAVEAAVLHEVTENFKYFNIAPFNPHIDIKSMLIMAAYLETRKTTPTQKGT